MKARHLAEPTSWRFYAGDSRLLSAAVEDVRLPDAVGRACRATPTIAQFWNQCQHGSWYFLPWHRGYLLAFEANIRAAVVQLGGPDDWALPYWNYFKPGSVSRCRPPSRRRTGRMARATTRSSCTQRYGPNERRQRVCRPRPGQPRCDGGPRVHRRRQRRQPRVRRRRYRIRARRAGARRHRVAAARLGARPGGRRRSAESTTAGPDVGSRHGRARPDLLAAPRQHRPAVGGLASESADAHRPDGGQTGSTAPASIGERRLLDADARRHALGLHARRDDRPGDARLRVRRSVAGGARDARSIGWRAWRPTTCRGI